MEEEKLYLIKSHVSRYGDIYELKIGYKRVFRGDNSSEIIACIPYFVILRNGMEQFYTRDPYYAEEKYYLYI